MDELTPVNLLINTPEDEFEYGPTLGNLEMIMEMVKDKHPNWTSLVVTFLPKK